MNNDEKCSKNAFFRIRFKELTINQYFTDRLSEDKGAGDTPPPCPPPPISQFDGIIAILIWRFPISYHAHKQIEISHHCCRRQAPRLSRPPWQTVRQKARSKSLRKV